MPAPKKVKKLGIIAGSGELPEILAKTCTENGTEIFVIGLDGQTDKSFLNKYPHKTVGIGHAGKIIGTLKQNDIVDLVMIGAVTRPGWHQIRPDLKGLEILSRIGFKALGDDNLLCALRKELEREGFKLHGLQEYVSDILTPEGILGKIKPTNEDWNDIRQGFELSQALGAIDVGQSVIVQQGLILGVEAIEGTDALIKRCADLQKPGRGAILVKSCKPQQDNALDLPTIGPKTIEALHKSKMSGIAIQAGKSFIVTQDKAVKLSDKYNLFLTGFSKTSLNGN
ncbi:MAG: UDP-2,3-diacylglucosamine diphosphatase LpxI [Alphaproteobacteria bacterium]|nr:UDP-2,3-diacylglucosamine diphosphatase LpxI [Alphaproteobacteria bacterium]